MPILEQIPLRLTLRAASNPPITPLDSNTGNSPKLWRAQSAAVAIGIFDAYDAPVDLSNVQYLQLILQRTADDLTPLVVKTVARTDPSWRDLITALGWTTGLDQNATFVLDAADTDQGLGGAKQAEFWCVIQGLTDANAPLTYGAGPLVIYNASTALPIGPTSYVSLHEQTTEEGNVTITPTSQQHTEILTVEGDTRTFSALLGVSGVVNGAQIEVLVFMPTETAGVIVQFRSQLVSNPVLVALTSDAGIARSLLRFYYQDGEWKLINTQSPAY